MNDQTEEFKLPFEFGEAESTVLSAALAYVDWYLMNAEQDEERKRKKGQVVHMKQDMLDRQGVAVVHANDFVKYVKRSIRDWPKAKKKMFLVEACLAQPFAPYELQFDEKDHISALKDLASCARLADNPDDTITQIFDSLESAREAHKHIGWGRIAVFGVLGALIIGLGGFLAAPLIAAQLGAAAGLSGAAAVAHGLALLGGGSLAAGGSGMVGGVWLVSGGGMALGLVGAGGGSLLFNLGSAAVLQELVKLQVTFHQVIIQEQFREAKAATVVETLIKQQRTLEQQLDRERELNEKFSDRLEKMEELIKAYGDSIRWMEGKEREAS